MRFDLASLRGVRHAAAARNAAETRAMNRPPAEGAHQLEPEGSGEGTNEGHSEGSSVTWGVTESSSDSSGVAPVRVAV